MSITKQDLKEVFYVMIGGLLGVTLNVLVKLIVMIQERNTTILLISLLIGILFGIYKIVRILSKGSLLPKIFKLIGKLYGLY